MQIDLRKNYDEVVDVEFGRLYRKSNVIQVWWERNPIGKKFDIPVQETWTAPDEKQAIENFTDMLERWK